MKRIPVILDTDIGDDIDDTWALALLLKSPELDVKLVVGDTADTTYRARLIARLLEVAGRSDIPVGIGIPNTGRQTPQRQTAWVEHYDLSHYPGRVHADGVQAMIDTIMQSPEPVTLICIGPVPNIAEALSREPRIAARTRFVGMHGSFHWHITTNLKLGMAPGAAAEWNVVCDARAAQKVFAAPWLDATITPTDTCGRVVLDGAPYLQLRDAADPLVRALIENYRLWAKTHAGGCDPETHSSVLFDCVAVHLAHTTRWLKMRQMGVRVDDEGYTREDPAARPFNVALEWENYGAFAADLVGRLLAPAVPAGTHVL
jgi:inosine-uridine nucleoside N-ribohydrolase